MQALVEIWKDREYREDARFGKLMYLVSRVAGGEADLEDFLPPRHYTAPKDRGQQALAVYLKSHAGT